MTDAFAPHMEALAREVWGDPNPSLSSKLELRWGAHGSRSVDLRKGVWHDHEAGEGGGVLDLLRREKGLVNGAALDHLREAHGAEVGRPREAIIAAPKRIAATYDYADENGEVLFQVVRYEPKEFRQRRPDGQGWSWSVKGVRQVPYGLDGVYALEGRGRVYVAEGEKDADALIARGLIATCNAGGAGKWTAEHAEHLTGLDVVILPDNDPAGQGHADDVGRSLQGVARSARVLRLPITKTKGDVSDWLEAGGDADALGRLADAAPLWAPAPPSSAFGAITWGDLDTVTQPPKWLVGDMIHDGDVALVYGASMSGKSFLSVDISLAVARGEPWMGKDTLKGGVIYQAGEGGKGLVKRLKAYRQERQVTGNLPFVLLPSKLDLYGSDEDTDKLITEIKAWSAWLSEPLRLVVIDTLSTASPGANENASEDVSRVLGRVERIRDATGACVILVHHKNAGGEKPRGHTSLFANADCAIEVNRDPDTDARSLKLAKCKDGEDGETLGFELQSVIVGSYDDGKPITSCVVRPAQLGTERTGERPRVSSGQRLFLTALDDATTQLGGELPPDAGSYGVSRGVSWHSFTTVYRAARGATHNDNALHQALKRDGEALLAKKMIGRTGTWVWLTRKGQEVVA